MIDWSDWSPPEVLLDGDVFFPLPIARLETLLECAPAAPRRAIRLRNESGRLSPFIALVGGHYAACCQSCRGLVILRSGLASEPRTDPKAPRLEWWLGACPACGGHRWLTTDAGRPRWDRVLRELLSGNLTVEDLRRIAPTLEEALEDVLEATP